jgi:glycolate oxidase FAD binding subunit
MGRLTEILAQERQRLPVDTPHPDRATIGGVVATASSGPRRYGWGTIRDYVIGIQAVDGRGTTFRGGGRVVKNVAGYDFCKLLTGSLGTLGIITEVTLRLQPMPDRLEIVSCPLAELGEAERLLAGLAESQIHPAAVELLCGTDWEDYVADGQAIASDTGLLMAVALEGTSAEVDEMRERLVQEWSDLGIAQTNVLNDEASGIFMGELADYAAEGDAPLVLRVSVRPSAVTRFIAEAQRVFPGACFQSHASNGIVVVKLAEFPPNGLAKTLVRRLQPLVSQMSGSIVMLANRPREEMTRQTVWGEAKTPFELMQRVKREFDPENVLNPGRFVYS